MHLKNCFVHILPTKFVKHFLRELLVGSLAEEGKQHPAIVHQTKYMFRLTILYFISTADSIVLEQTEDYISK